MLGLWLLSSALPTAGYYAVAIYGSGAQLSRANYAALTQLAIELVVSLWLLFGARGIFRLVQLARDYGREAES